MTVWLKRNINSWNRTLNWENKLNPSQTSSKWRSDWVRVSLSRTAKYSRYWWNQGQSIEDSQNTKIQSNLPAIQSATFSKITHISSISNNSSSWAILSLKIFLKMSRTKYQWAISEKLNNTIPLISKLQASTERTSTFSATADTLMELSGRFISQLCRKKQLPNILFRSFRNLEMILRPSSLSPIPQMSSGLKCSSISSK